MGLAVPEGAGLRGTERREGGKVLGAENEDLKSVVGMGVLRWGWRPSSKPHFTDGAQLPLSRAEPCPTTHPHGGGGQGPSPAEGLVGFSICKMETIILTPPWKGLVRIK